MERRAKILVAILIFVVVRHAFVSYFPQDPPKKIDSAKFLAETEAMLKSTAHDGSGWQRRITGVQSQKIGKQLAERTSRVRIVCVANDSEALKYSDNIEKAVSPWQVTRATFRSPGTAPLGIAIVGTVESDVTLVRNAFQKAGVPFHAAPFEEKIVQDGDVPSDAEQGVEILVGARPLLEGELSK